MVALSAALVSLFAAAFALPQGGSGPTTHTVDVGLNGTLTFTPEALFANIGDDVIFRFHPKNHSAVQSSFANPCGPMDGGFNAGFFPVAANETDFPTFTYTVTTTDPVWVYCAQGNGLHCHSGMVFAINCPASGPKSFDNFKAAAIAQGAATATPTSAPDVAAVPDTTTYPGITIPPAPVGTLVTSTVALDSSTWTTTYTSYPGSPDPTPNSLAGSVIDVQVGANGELAYSPSEVTAKPRDTIVFHFNPKNHTVVQSSFADPCRPLDLTNPNVTSSIDSGFMPVPAGATELPTFSVTINDTAPLWFYCKQANHCGQGMVFAVNAVDNSTHSFAAFKQLAMQINGTTAANSTAGSGAAPGYGTGSATRYSANAALAVVSLAIGALLL